MCWVAPLPPLYIGGEGGLRPHLGFHPRGGSQPKIPSEGAAKGGRGGNLPPQVRWRRPLPKP